MHDGLAQCVYVPFAWCEVTAAKLELTPHTLAVAAWIRSTRWCNFLSSWWLPLPLTKISTPSKLMSTCGLQWKEVHSPDHLFTRCSPTCGHQSTAHWLAHKHDNPDGSTTSKMDTCVVHIRMALLKYHHGILTGSAPAFIHSTDHEFQQKPYIFTQNEIKSNA